MTTNVSTKDAFEERVPVFSIRGFFAPQISMPLVVIALLALLSPVDVISRHEWSRPITEFVVKYLPNIQRYADSTAYPEVALLVGSLIWIFWPWCSLMYAFCCLLNWEKARAKMAMFPPFSWKQHATLLLGVPFFLGAMWFVTAVPGDPNVADGLTTRNRIGFAFMNTLSLWLASVAVGLQYANVRILLDKQRTTRYSR